MEDMRPKLARIVVAAVLTLSGAAAGSPGVGPPGPVLTKSEAPVAMPSLSAPPPSCDTALRIHQATLARSAPLDATEVRLEISALAPTPGPLKNDPCTRAAAELLRDLALRAHHEAQAQGTAAAYQLALDLYRAALRHAQGTSNPRLHYGSAEVLFKLAEAGTPARYCEAAPIYSQAIDVGGAPRIEAAQAAVVAWERCLEGVTYRSSKAERRAEYDEPEFAVRPFPPPVQSLFAAMNAYLQAAAGSPPTPALVLIKYRRARILYEHNRITEALPGFREVTEKHPGSEVAVYAANLLLDCIVILLNVQTESPEARDARMEELSVTAERMLAEPLLTRHHELEELLHKLQLAVGRKRAEQLEKAGLWSQAADGYMALATRYPQVPQRSELLYNAAFLLERSRRPQEALAARELLVKQHPDDPLAKKSLFRLAQTYAGLSDYEHAATLYEDFARRFPGELRDSPWVDAMQGLGTAIQYRARLGQLDRAVQGMDQLLKTYGPHASVRSRASALFLALSWIYDETDGSKHKEHLLQLRKLSGPSAPIELQIVTAARLGELAFRAACPVATTQGLCLSNPTGPRAPSVQARKPALRAEAAAYFSQVLKAYRDGAAASAVREDITGTRELRVAMLERAVARVRLLSADQLFEEMLAARTGTEREGKQREALALYQLVLGMPGVDGTIAVTAAAHLAQLHLFAARASCPLVKGSACGQVPGAAPTTGVWAQAEQALQRCLEVAAERTMPEASALCAAELHALRPTKHRLDAELRLVPDHPSPLIDRAPVLGGND